MASGRSGENGFTMIEAVVALAVVSIVLAAIGSLVAGNVRGAKHLEQHAALVHAARLVESTLPHAGAPLPKDLAGKIADNRWQIRVTPFLGYIPSIPGSPFVPQRVELRVQSPSGAILSLETIRLQSRNGG